MRKLILSFMLIFGTSNFYAMDINEKLGPVGNYEIIRVLKEFDPGKMIPLGHPWFIFSIPYSMPSAKKLIQKEQEELKGGLKFQAAKVVLQHHSIKDIKKANSSELVGLIEYLEKVKKILD